MFTHLASYFLGAVVKDDATANPSAETRLHETEEDDWLLVDKSEVQDENEALPLERRSRRSSTSSLPSPGGMDESWFVTPPPCFTSAGPITLETSPLENLLIEHPSMSVYHHPHHNHQLNLNRNRSRSASVSSARTSSPSQPRQPQPAQQPLQPLQPNNRRQAPVVYHHNSTDIVSQLKSAQKQQQRKMCQQLKRNQMERNNKAREYGSRNKQQRRADRQNHLSGANNNRKPC